MSFEYESNRANIEAKVDNVLNGYLKDASKVLLKNIKANAEAKGIRDTGFYIDRSWSSTVFGNKYAEIKSRATYAAVQETGSRLGHPARPHVKPAVDDFKNNLSTPLFKRHWKAQGL